MEDIEICLNKLSQNEAIYAEISKKLGTHLTSAKEVEEYLNDITTSTAISVCISDESAENSDISEICNAISESVKKNPAITAIFRTEEFLNIIDDKDHITEISKPRSLVHRDGDFHAAVHIWIIRKRDMGIYVLLQKRSHDKDISPDCYDVSAAGHVSQGEELRDTAVRETEEELGLKIHGSKLEFLGLLRNEYHSGDVNDNELRAVYLCREPVDENNLSLQTSEVSSVCWAELDELLSVMDSGTFMHCLDPAELELIKKAVF